MKSTGLATQEQDDIFEDIRPQVLDFDDGVSMMDATWLGLVPQQVTETVPEVQAVQPQPLIQAPIIQHVNPQVPAALAEAPSTPWAELATVAQQNNQILEGIRQQMALQTKAMSDLAAAISQNNVREHPRHYDRKHYSHRPY